MVTRWIICGEPDWDWTIGGGGVGRLDCWLERFEWFEWFERFEWFEWSGGSSCHGDRDREGGRRDLYPRR